MVVCTSEHHHIVLALVAGPTDVVDRVLHRFSAHPLRLACYALLQIILAPIARIDALTLRAAMIWPLGENKPIDAMAGALIIATAHGASDARTRTKRSCHLPPDRCFSIARKTQHCSGLSTQTRTHRQLDCLPVAVATTGFSPLSARLDVQCIDRFGGIGAHPLYFGNCCKIAVLRTHRYRRQRFSGACAGVLKSANRRIMAISPSRLESLIRTTSLRF